MEVILLEKVAKLGELGDKVKVKSGYGRNYLLPFGKALPATSENVARFEAQRAELEARQAEHLVAAKARAEALVEVSVSIAAKAGDEGKLFGSIGTRDIAEAMVKAGHPVEKSEVRLPEGPLRQVGEYVISVSLHPDVSTDVRIVVLPE